MRTGQRDDHLGRTARHRQPLLLALALCLFLVVGVPVLVLATMPAVRAEDQSATWSDGLPSEIAVDPAADDRSGDDHGDQAGDTQDPEPVLAGATAAAQQVLTATRSQPAPAQPDRSGADHPAGGTLVASAASAATGSDSDHHGPDGRPLTTPDLGSMVGSRNPRPEGESQQAAEGEDGEGEDGEGEGDPRLPDVPVRAGQASALGWRIHLVWGGGEDLDPVQPGPARPDPVAAVGPGDRAPAAVPRGRAVQPHAVTAEAQPDQGAGAASLVIAGDDPGESAWAHVVDAGFPAVDRVRVHLDDQPSPAPAAERAGYSGAATVARLVPLADQLPGSRLDRRLLLDGVPVLAAAAAPVHAAPDAVPDRLSKRIDDATSFAADFAAGVADELYLWMLVAADVGHAIRRAPEGLWNLIAVHAGPVIWRTWNGDLDQLRANDRALRAVLAPVAHAATFAWDLLPGWNLDLHRAANRWLTDLSEQVTEAVEEAVKRLLANPDPRLVAHWLTDALLGPHGREPFQAYLAQGRPGAVIGRLVTMFAVIGGSAYVTSEYLHNLRGLIPRRLPEARMPPQPAADVERPPVAGARPPAGAAPPTPPRNRTGAPLLDRPPPEFDPDGTLIPRPDGSHVPEDLRARGLIPPASVDAKDRVAAAAAMALDATGRPVDAARLANVVDATFVLGDPSQRQLPYHWLRGLVPPLEREGVTAEHIGQQSRIRLISVQDYLVLDDEAFSGALAGGLDPSVEHFSGPGVFRHPAVNQRPMTLADLEEATRAGHRALAVIRVPAPEHLPGQLRGYEFVVVDRVLTLPPPPETLGQQLRRWLTGGWWSAPPGQRVLAIRNPRGPQQYLQLEESFLRQFDQRGLILRPTVEQPATIAGGPPVAGARPPAGAPPPTPPRNRTGAPLLDRPPPGFEPDGTLAPRPGSPGIPEDLQARVLIPPSSARAGSRAAAALAMALDAMGRRVNLEFLGDWLDSFPVSMLRRNLPYEWLRQLVRSLEYQELIAEHIGPQSRVRRISLEEFFAMDREAVFRYLRGAPDYVEHFHGSGVPGHRAVNQRPMTLADLERATRAGNPALAVIRVPAPEYLPGELPGYEFVVVDRVFTVPPAETLWQQLWRWLTGGGQRVLAIRSPRGPQGPQRYLQLEESFLRQFDQRGLTLQPLRPPEPPP